MATSLVISSAGFIGSNIVRHHVARGKAVRVLDNFSPGGIFSIACGKRYTLLELLDVLSNIIEVKVEKVHTEPRPGDVRHSLVSISQAEAQLGLPDECGS